MSVGTSNRSLHETPLDAKHPALAHPQDFVTAQASLEYTHRALLNILDDFATEKSVLEHGQRAVLNILDDFDDEKAHLEGAQRAALNLLEDFEREKRRLEEVQRATVNVLEDFDAERARLEESQRALLNILDDVDLEQARVAAANQELQNEIAERIRAQEELNRFFTLSLDMLCIAGFDGFFKRLNPAWEKTLGYTTEEMLAKPYIEFVHRDDGAATLAEAQKLSTGAQTISFENRYRCKDGSYKWLLWSATPYQNEQLIYAAARDITERKRAEEELRKLNTELESFTYSVSHDLRAPLRHVDGFARILAEELGPQLDATFRHYLQRIQDGTRQMGRLVDDLLNLARIGRQEVRVQVTGLNSLLEQVLAELNPDTEGRQIEWRIGRLPFVECDPALIKQVFANLLSNAVKFTRPRERAVIQVDQTATNGQPTIFVRDNGVGFSMKYADKLFGVFQRLHRPEDFEGTGVGLATVQRIIHKHDGQVWAEAELDKGAAFFFTLPSRESAAPRNPVLGVNGKGES